MEKKKQVTNPPTGGFDQKAQNEIAERHGFEEKPDLKRLILANMAKGVCLVRDSDEIILYANPQFERMFGYGPGELYGKPVALVSYQDESNSATVVTRAIIAKSRQTGEATYEVHNIKKDGTPFWCSVHTLKLDYPEYGTVWFVVHQDITAQKQVEAEPAQLAAIVQSSDDAGKMTSISATACDISGRKKAKQTEEELRRSREQLRNLSAYLQAAREQERAHIAREIHDELGQTLTALKLDLSWLSKHLHKDQRPLKEKTNVMSQFVEATIQTVQRIVAELRPGLLDDLGLVAAIDWQTKQFRERTGIACEFMQAPENIVLDRERSTVIFRILQEALTNVTRHARATKVKISLTRKEQRLVLKVRDNGQGITSSQISAANSFGLIGMRERVHPWQGRVKIKGVPNQGTIVYVSLPLDI